MKKSIFFLTMLLSMQLFAACEPEVAPEPLPEPEPTDIGSGEVNGYKMVWEDTFNDSILDETNRWTVEVNGNGGGNSELQYYRRENIREGVEPVSKNGCLIITARKESFSGKTCTSGRLTTSGKMSFKHGKVEARIKLPKTANGLWPAFWMLGADFPTVGWPKSGEIDILEMGNINGINRGTQEKYFSSWFHWGESWNGGSYPNWGKDFTNPTSIQDDFHLFTLIWDDNVLKTYLDLDKNPSATPICEMAINGSKVPGNAAYYFHKQFFVIFNLAIGGNFTQIWDINKITALNAANNYTANMYIDFVRVYQKSEAGEEFTSKIKTSLPKLTKENQFSVYPVPAKQILHIAGPEQPQKIVVVGMNGHVFVSTQHTSQLNTANLTAGNYIIQITDSNGNVEQCRFVKE
jgi:beta-glucanase (GH16 family)